MKNPKPPCILYVSSFPPRECGIATFTQDLTNAVDKEFGPTIKSKVLAINDNGTSIYNYPRKVIMNMNEVDMEDYINYANDINKMTEIKVINIQHEYGLFGGNWGDYILPFLELLKKPVVITMHTVLPKPREKLKKITRAMAEKASTVVVMTQHAKRLLNEDYDIPNKKINVIPHGVHHVPFPSKSRAKKKVNLAGRTVLSTFGMLNRDKGLEYAIQALPEVVKEFPNLLYIIVGATHPLIVKQEGERYRNKLKKIVMQLKLKDHVKFYNKYVELQELIDYLRATDIYISPTLNPLQAVSGTVSYAMSCACPTIVTENQYAKDVITPERGILVRFKNAKDIEKALFDLLRDKKARNNMKKNAYFYSRHMTWQNVALSYFNLYNEHAKIVPKRKDKLPNINLGHTKALTDAFGMIQFARHTKPDMHSGYNLDDNARALLSYSQYHRIKQLKTTREYILKYLKFVRFCQKSNGKFHNFVSPNRSFIDRTESEDSFGRAIWALGYVISAEHLPENIRKQAMTMFKKTIKWMPKLMSLRAISFTIIGLSYSLDNEECGTEYLTQLKRLADKLQRRFIKQTEINKDWIWFEDCLTYSNYKLPEAMFAAYKATKNKEYLVIAEKSIDFITSISYEKNFFSPIGQDGWYFANGKRAYFDQQPEDTAGATEAYVTAYKSTKKKKYLRLALKTYEWFLGKNHLNQMVYDEATGGCYDGLGRYSLNFNQGAESTLSYLLARLAVNDLDNK